MSQSPGKNIEVKARYPDLAKARATAKRIDARLVEILIQTDTYFRSPKGGTPDNSTRAGSDLNGSDPNRGTAAGGVISNDSDPDRSDPNGGTVDAGISTRSTPEASTRASGAHDSDVLGGSILEGRMRDGSTSMGSPTDGWRLKLRQIQSDGRDQAELIRYRRANDARARASLYTIEALEDATSTLESLTASAGVLCVVCKRRELYLWKNVRIHLDTVQGLGDFLEFEGVVSSTDDQAISRQRVENLVIEFAIAPADQIGVSYSDLLLALQKTECGAEKLFQKPTRSPNHTGRFQC